MVRQLPCGFFQTKAARQLCFGTVRKTRTKCSFLDMGTATDFVIQGSESGTAIAAVTKGARLM
jgi:hypothetical protein